MTGRRRVVVVGAGPAAHAVVETLLAADVSMAIDVVGAEDRAPYNRTTINKGLLSGGTTEDAIDLAVLSHPQLRWHLGRVAAGIDPAARRVELDDGTQLAGDAIVLATGSRPRVLPIPIAPQVAERVLTLRTPSDTQRLRVLAGQGPVVVAGAGLIGNELPAQLRFLTSSVSLVDPADRPLARQVGPLVGDWITAEHHAADTATYRRRSVAAVESTGGASGRGGVGLRVNLDDGTELEAAVVVACLGARPDVAWLARAGITVHEPSGGLMVDTKQRLLGHPGLYAAGDVAAVPIPSGRRVRIEHWGSAIQQGRTAARRLLLDLGLVHEPDLDDRSVVMVSPPSHSTYIAQTKLTFFGWPTLGRFREHIVAGELGRTRSLVVHTVDGCAIGAIGVGGARAVTMIRDHIARGAPLDEIVDALAAA